MVVVVSGWLTKENKKRGKQTQGDLTGEKLSALPCPRMHTGITTYECGHFQQGWRGAG